MTIKRSLSSISAYPISDEFLEKTCLKRGIDIEAEATNSILFSDAYQLAKADCLMWLSVAPNVNQDGISYSFTTEEKKRLIKNAQYLYDLCGEENTGSSSIQYGYKGSKL